MALVEQINQDLLTATKAATAVERDTLRLVAAALTNARIAKGQDLTDEDVVAVLAREVKQRHESIAAFKAGGRSELAAKEEAEVAILTRYLPEQLDEATVKELVKEAIAEAGASSMADMGKVMAALMPKLKGRADGAFVSQLVREQLNLQ